jgi:iron complex transport system substrate-binding protein
MMRWALMFLLTLSPLAAADEARPTVVSLDYCADQFVLGLADREQVRALSKDAERPFSYLRDRAKGLPKIRSVAEDVVALQPDIVVRSWGGDARALVFYERMGIRTVQIGYASDMEGAARITREVGAALGQKARANALVSSMPGARSATGDSALYITPGGVTAGEGTMVDAIIHRAGLENAATGIGWYSLPLETLVIQPPAVALTAFFGFDDFAFDQWSSARHPALAYALKDAKVVRMTESRLTCPAWFVADEARDVAGALEAAR